jgi:hypothetical protein
VSLMFVYCQEKVNRSLGYSVGRSTAKEFSRRLPTTEARLRSQVKSCGICGGQSGTGVRFFRVLRFPLPFLIAHTAPYSHNPGLVQ